MKRIWSYILAALGFSSNAYADCYKTAIEAFNVDSVEAAIDYCVDSDLREIEVMRETYNEATNDEKYLMSLRAGQISERLEQMGFGDVVTAAAVCAICQGGGNNR